jgi:hypothetical protein
MTIPKYMPTQFSKSRTKEGFEGYILREKTPTRIRSKYKQESEDK